jgi:anaerobic selenocysteine-containing dehydrogenase
VTTSQARSSATTCPLDCADACGVVVETDAEGRFESLRGDPRHPWSRGVLCGKTALYGEVVNAPNRLLFPMLRENGQLVRATWDAALDRIAERVGPLAGQDVLALQYGGSMGLVQRKFPLRVMNALGATLHDGGICDATADVGFQTVLGRVLGPDLDEVDACDLLLLWGCDMARTVQHLQPRVKTLQERGVPVVAIDVWRTDTIADVERRGGLGFQIRPGTDAQLALCLARIAFERGAVDRSYVMAECSGAEEFEAHVRARHDVAETAGITGLDPAQIDLAGAARVRARAPFVKTGVGWARRRNGGNSMRSVCALAAILGHGNRVHFESYAHFGLAEDVIMRPDLRPADAPTRDGQPGRSGSAARIGPFPRRFRVVPRPGRDAAGQRALPPRLRARRPVHRRPRPLRDRDGGARRRRAAGDDVRRARRRVPQLRHRCVQRARRAARPPARRARTSTRSRRSRALDLRARRGT